MTQQKMDAAHRNTVRQMVGRRSYPDYALIKRLRAKFMAYSISSLTTTETVDLINHLSEALADARKANTEISKNAT